MGYEVPASRPLPPWVKGQLPTQAMADLLRAQRQELASAEERLAGAEKASLKLAEAFALALWKKRGDAKDLRILFEALASAGVELLDHIGEEIADELVEMADIIDWVDAAEGITPGCVAEAFEPEVRLNGRLAHRAKLIGVLEAEEAAEPSPPPSKPEPARVKNRGSSGFTTKTSQSQRKKQR